MVPNHALIIHALLHGDDDFQKSLMIVNTRGWVPNCNSGNVGCILGIKNGLAAIDAVYVDYLTWDGKQLFSVEDTDRPLGGGGVALVVEEGRIMCDAVAVSPLQA